MLKFQIQQIALSIPDAQRAQDFLAKIGLTEWFHDHVVARGFVFKDDPYKGSHHEEVNEADLRFNYQAGTGADEGASKPLELEILDYRRGDNWISENVGQDDAHNNQVSHLGMHVSAEELVQWRAFFAAEDIQVAQEVNTESHTNPAIKDSRRYNYVIFDTRGIIGVDLKFIVRKDI
ncbi:glyoxalase/bleomycin resistance protein/dihydroxybiphenyl dioxygenase-like superfamily protein [Serratia phage MTx]|uniref:Glyoxalase/bleomycin resistance protein/dihydroxybiphenyl dioxygenase-like superfamily protein n=1 Tax=Serratia phage MTx TaxID=2557553 RepID=A0A482MII6_9CAUD|nr:glyoxalase/bleomycin resistance protein/dihydroxybiphenyl dioxygenase-like superfamily protein [Serratia phage MTx]QBQ72377.1 glyoxalase/bleomycin resistance protein/dihydroxybiphenyl dioxygenase-like superfamily protein [Serratia phage MTx]